MSYELYQHQKQAIEKFKKVQYNIDASEVGVGKTLVQIELLKLRKSGLNLIICPKITLVNWQRELERFFPEMPTTILNKGKVKNLAILRKFAVNQSRHTFTITYDSARLIEKALYYFDWDTVILDECFTGDTLINTPFGKKQIRNIKPGDLVYTKNGINKVLKKHIAFSYWILCITLSNGRTIKTTPNHLFFINGKWIKAKDIKQYDYLTMLPIKKMSYLRRIIPSIKSKGIQAASVLWDFMFGKMENESTGNKKSCKREDSQNERELDSRKEKTSIFKFIERTKREKALEQRHSTNRRDEKEIINDNEREKPSKRGKWNGDDSPPKNSIRPTFNLLKKLGAGIYSIIRETVKRLSIALQNRYSEPSKNDCNRSRRRKPQSNFKATGRQKENREVNFIRVESISIQKQNNPEKVYDLTVENDHNYFAEDVLVHNCHSVKSPKSKRTKSIVGGTKKQPGIRGKYKSILSATLTSNELLDAFMPIQFLSKDILGGNYYQLREKYYYKLNDWKWALKKNMMDEFNHRVSDYMVNFSKRDCVDLPDIVHETITLEMNAEQKRLYKEMKEELIIELGNNETIRTPFQVTALQKLMQISSGWIYNADHQAIHITDTKIKSVNELIESISGKIIIFTVFQESARQLADSVPDSILYRGQKEIDLFRAKHKVLIMNIRQGIGINLEFAQTIIRYEHSFSLVDTLQSEGRIDRITQKNKMTVFDIVISPIEKYALKKVQAKEDLLRSITKTELLENV